MHTIASVISCGPSRWSVPHAGWRSALMLGSNIEAGELIVYAVM
jgi:hypothetical protein